MVNCKLRDIIKNRPRLSEIKLVYPDKDVADLVEETNGKTENQDETAGSMDLGYAKRLFPGLITSSDSRFKWELPDCLPNLDSYFLEYV